MPWSKESKAKAARTRASNKAAKEALVHVQETIPQEAIDYLHGWLRGRIEAFAERIGVPASDLTERVAELLHQSQRRPRKMGA